MENKKESCGKSKRKLRKRKKEVVENQKQVVERFPKSKRKLWKVGSCGKSLRTLKIGKKGSCGTPLKDRAHSVHELFSNFLTVPT